MCDFLSFLLAVPTMLTATIMDVAKTSFAFTLNEVIALSTGFIISFIVALLSIKFLLSYIRKNDFIGFGFTE
ncbi:MAG: undecaprenyl-diphosphate phosphatase [bacterium]|nr:undecaprenyl-diphosphate phosphatase [bacterium]